MIEDFFLRKVVMKHRIKLSLFFKNQRVRKVKLKLVNIFQDTMFL
jgi:hypothetical protein